MYTLTYYNLIYAFVECAMYSLETYNNAPSFHNICIVMAISTYPRNKLNYWSARTTK